MTGRPNENNWYAAHDEGDYRTGFIHVDDFSWATSAPSSVVNAHFVLKGVLNALIAGFDPAGAQIWHDQPRGCLFDFCEEKTDLNLKLRTADICGDCMEILREVRASDSLIQQVIEIMDAGRLLSLSTRQFRRVEEQFNQWPFPVAVTRHKVVQATDPLLKFLLLLDHFDSLIRYFYLIREILEGRRPMLEDRPSLGWWVDQLARSLQGQPLFREVVRIAQQERVVSLRNERRGHGYMASHPEAYADEASQLEQIMARIEKELTPFLAGHRLIIPRQTAPKHQSFSVEGEELRGSHLLHPSFRTSLVNPIDAGLGALNEVFVSDPAMQRFHNLSPFIVSEVCPTCHHPRILVTDGGDQYIDVFMGHRVRIQGALEP